MKFNKKRILFFIRRSSILILVFVSLHLALNKDDRKAFFSYFSTRCLDYRQKEFSRKLNDRLVNYSAQAKRNGIQPCKTESDIRKRVREGKLVKVRTSRMFIVDKLTYSYPYVTKDTRALIEEIGERFREKTSKKGLSGSKFIITSMTRKTESIKSLRKFNMNASENSPHQYGNAFDISYKRILARKMVLTNCDEKYLKEALAEVIWQLRAEKKCWATYERGQSCFHVVAR